MSFATRRWLRCCMLLVALGGCRTDELNSIADRLLDALSKNDLQSFEAIAHPELLRHERRDKFGAFSGAVGRMGSYHNKTLVGVGAKTDGVRQGTYLLLFSKGTVTMSLAVKDGKVYSMSFSGRSFVQRLQMTPTGETGALHVQSFRWVHPDKERGDRFRVGERIQFELQLTGLRRDSKGVRARTGLMVINAGGTVVLDKPSFAEITSNSAGPTTAIRGGFVLAEPGRYRVTLSITDMKSRSSLDHAETVTVFTPEATPE